MIVVAHGGVTVDALRTIAGDATIEREQPMLIAEGVPCCAITRLRNQGNGWSVAALPSTAHLDGGSVDHRPA